MKKREVEKEYAAKLAWFNLILHIFICSKKVGKLVGLDLYIFYKLSSNSQMIKEYRNK